MTDWPPLPRDCEVCGQRYHPRSKRQRWCSPRCRNRGKYLAIRNDPERWSAYLERERESYQPHPRILADRRCSVDDCEVKHFAKGFCRRHYYRDRYRRGLDRAEPPSFIGAIIRTYDEADTAISERPGRLVCRVSRDLLWPECPECGGQMRKVPHTEHDVRACNYCPTKVALNAEEVGWLIYEKRSTAQQERTAS